MVIHSLSHQIASEVAVRGQAWGEFWELTGEQLAVSSLREFANARGRGRRKG